MATGAIVARILTQYSDKGSKQAQKDIKKLGADFDKFAKKSFQAFGLAAAASAAFAAKVGTDAVKAAIEDQKSQVILANSLRNTTGATDEAIKATEDYISKQQLLVGVSDTELRQSLITLTGATRNLSEAQSLQNIALDVAASGYGDVNSVSKALAKAYAGNLGALKKLVPGMDASIVKSKDFNKAMEFLVGTMGGAAAAAADTLEGRLRILRLSYDEILESLGYALLPVVQEFAGYLLSDVLPRVQAWVDLNKDELAKGLKDATGFLKTLIEKAFIFSQWAKDNLWIVKSLGIAIAALFVTNKIAAFVTAIGTITTAMAALRATAFGTAIATAFATGGLSLATAATALAAIGVTALVTKNAMNLLSKDSTKATKASGKLGASHVASTKFTKDLTATVNKYNASVTNTTSTTKTLTDEQKKSLEVQKQLKAQFGVTTKETDPVQLEAARLNLIKQQALGIEAVSQKILDSLNLQLTNNLAAQRYADILAVIADKKITTAEVEALADKWGKSKEFVLKYIEQVTGIKDIVLDKDFGADAANGWQKAIDKLKEYLTLLSKLTTPGTTTSSFNPSIGAQGGIGTTTISPTISSDAAIQGTFEKVFTDSVSMGNNQTQSAALALSSARYEALAQSYAGYNAGAGSGAGITVNVNAGNVIADRNELVEIVRGGILAGQISGNKITLNALDL
jgi:hypothetical protein